MFPVPIHIDVTHFAWSLSHMYPHPCNRQKRLWGALCLISIALIQRVQMEIRKKKRKVLFVSSISSPQLHCTSPAPSLPSPLVSRLRAALMQEIWGSQCTKGPRFPTSTLHTAQKCILMVRVLGTFRVSFEKFWPFSLCPPSRSEENCLLSRSCHCEGSLHFSGGCASACVCMCARLRASEGTGRARSGEERGSGDEWRVSQVLRLSPG